MSPAPRAERPLWRPTATREALIKRAQILQHLRAFFNARDVLEVETPSLYPAAAPDVHLHSLSTTVRRRALADGQRVRCWLPTSPEYPLKRLLCAGYGDVYALGRVFRDGDDSRRHLPEFTLLEWYRQGLDLQAIMDETVELVASVLSAFGEDGSPPVRVFRYDALFAHFLGIEDVYHVPVETFRQALSEAGVEVVGLDETDRVGWRQLALATLIEPRLQEAGLVLVWGWPAEEAALAALDAEQPHIALRFELYLHGVELANGYQELQAGQAYRARFEAWNRLRQRNGQPSMPLDDALLAALDEVGGLPFCSGVALGVDRLVMLALGCDDIAEATAFGRELMRAPLVEQE